MGIDPVSLAIASAAFQGVSAVRGYMQERKAEKATKNANRAAMAAAEEEARLTRADAGERARAEKLDAARVRAQQIAAYMKSGVTLDGSPLLVSNETTETGNTNASNVMANADSQSKSLILRGKAGQQPIQRADFFGTAADALGSAGKAYGMAKTPKAYGF